MYHATTKTRGGDPIPLVYCVKFASLNTLTFSQCFLSSFCIKSFLFESSRAKVGKIGGSLIEVAFSCHNGWLDRKGDEEPGRMEKGFVGPSTLAHSSTCPIKCISSCTFIHTSYFVQESSFIKAGNGWEGKKSCFFSYRTWECSKVGVCSERPQKRGFGKRRQKKVSMSSPSSPSPSLRKPPLISRYPPFTAARPSHAEPTYPPTLFSLHQALRTHLPTQKKGGKGNISTSFDKNF